MSKTTTTTEAAAIIDVDAIKASVVKNAHPAANLFPMMSSDEFDNLCVSLRQHGFDASKPIKRKEGKITDGRNREAATKVVNAEIENWNVEHPTEPKALLVPVYADDESDNDANVLDTVIRDNFTRRHLTASQKAAVLVKAGILGDAYARKKELGEAGKKIKGDITAMVAAQHRVNVDYVYKVKAIAAAKDKDGKNIGQALLEAIANGEKSVMAAHAEIAKLGSGEESEGAGSEDEKAKAVKDGTGAVVPSEWEGTFSVRAKFTEAASLLRQLRSIADEIATHEGGKFLTEGDNLKNLKASVSAVGKNFRTVEPHIVCPHCGGDGKHPEKKGKHVCPVCGGYGFITEAMASSYEKHGALDPDAVSESADELTGKGEAEAPAPKKSKKKTSKLAGGEVDEDGFPVTYADAPAEAETTEPAAE